MTVQSNIPETPNPKPMMAKLMAQTKQGLASLNQAKADAADAAETATTADDNPETNGEEAAAKKPKAIKPAAKPKARATKKPAAPKKESKPKTSKPSKPSKPGKPKTTAVKHTKDKVIAKKKKGATAVAPAQPAATSPTKPKKIRFALKVLERRAMKAQQRRALAGKGVCQDMNAESHPPFYRQVNEQLAEEGVTWPSSEPFQMTRSARATTTSLVLEELRVLANQIAIICRRTNRKTVSLTELTTATYLLEPLGVDTSALRESIHFARPPRVRQAHAKRQETGEARAKA